MQSYKCMYYYKHIKILIEVYIFVCIHNLYLYEITHIIVCIHDFLLHNCLN